jgi:hypothetical protein
MLAVHLMTMGQGVSGVTPAMVGLMAALAGFLVMLAARLPLARATSRPARSRLGDGQD